MFIVNYRFKSDINIYRSPSKRIAQSLNNSLMNLNQLIAQPECKPSKKKFDELTITEVGLILEYKDKKIDEILFLDIHKSYVKKRKLSSMSKLLSVLVSLVFLVIVADLFSFFFFIVLIILTFLFDKINTFKWYEFNIICLDGSRYNKLFFIYNKRVHIEMVSIISREIFNHRT